MLNDAMFFFLQHIASSCELPLLMLSDANAPLHNSPQGQQELQQTFARWS